MKKKFLLLILIIALCLVGCGKKEEEKKEEKKEEGPYRLVKYADGEQASTQVISIDMKDDYFYMTTYNRLNGLHELLIYRDGKLVLSQNVDARRVAPGRYYAFKDDHHHLIDYDNIGISETEYEWMDPFEGGIIVADDGKAGMIDFDGKVVIDLDYDYLEYNSSVYQDKCAYLLALKGKNVGVINYKGEEVIPFEYGMTKTYNREYDYTNIDVGSIYCKDDVVRFILQKGGKEYLVDENNKVLLEGTDIYYYYGDHFEVDGNIYDVDGNKIEGITPKINVVDHVNYKDEFLLVKPGKTNDLEIYDENFKKNEQVLENVYYAVQESPDGDYNEYYVTNTIYFSKVDKKNIELRKIKNNETVETYNKVEAIAIRSGVEDDVKYYFLVCKDSKCGLLDENGKEILPLEYKSEVSDWFNSLILSKGNEYNVLSPDGIHTFECSEGNKITGDIQFAGDGYYITIGLGKNSSFIYNSKCEKIIEESLRNKRLVFDGKLFIIELESKAETKNGIDTYEYVFFNDKGEQITPENKDDAKLTMYLGEVDGKAFFYADKGIYYLTNE